MRATGATTWRIGNYCATDYAVTMTMVINKLVAAAVLLAVVGSYLVVFSGPTIRGLVDFFLLSLATVILAALNALIALIQRNQKSAPRHPFTLITNVTSIGVLLLIAALIFMVTGGSPTDENGSNIGAGLVMLGVHLFAFFNAILVLVTPRARAAQPDAHPEPQQVSTPHPMTEPTSDPAPKTGS